MEQLAEERRQEEARIQKLAEQRIQEEEERAAALAAQRATDLAAAILPPPCPDPTWDRDAALRRRRTGKQSVATPSSSGFQHSGVPAPSTQAPEPEGNRVKGTGENKMPDTAETFYTVKSLPPTESPDPRAKLFVELQAIVAQLRDLPTLPADPMDPRSPQLRAMSQEEAIILIACIGEMFGMDPIEDDDED